ncbi:MAG: HDOD domain-containing protein [Planctomycetota bacterium]
METVVVVEKQALVRELLAGALEAERYLVLTAPSLDEAAELVTGVAPNLLIVDPACDPSADLLGLAGLWDALESRPQLLLLHQDLQAATAEAFVEERKGACVARDAFERQAFLKACRDLIPAAAASSGTSAPSLDPPSKSFDSPAHAAPKPSATAPTTPKPVSVAPIPAIDELGLLKTLKPVVTRDQLEEATARGVMLPLDTKVSARVGALLDQADASPADLCRAVARDPALSLRVLAASAAISEGRREPVRSVATAIDRVGKAGIATILTKAEQDGDPQATCEALTEDLKRCGIDRRAAWRHAHAVALIAGEVARLGGGNADDVQAARTVGWLHDLGRQVFATTLPDAYAEACEAAVALGLPLVAVESQMMLDHHGQLMEKLLRGLRLAPALATSIGCHQLPLIEARNLSGKHFQETLTLAIADRYAAALGTGDPVADPLRGLEHHAAALKLDAKKLAASLDACRRQLDQDVASFSKAVGEAMPTDPPWLATLDAAVRQTLGTLFVGNDPNNDAFAVLARQLNASAEIKPSVAVVRLTNVRDRDPLTGKLRGWEFEHGVGRLPVLLISPKGNLTLEDGAMAGRAVQCLAEPVSPRRIAAALNTLLQAEPAASAQAA